MGSAWGSLNKLLAGRLQMPLLTPVNVSKALTADRSVESCSATVGFLWNSRLLLRTMSGRLCKGAVQSIKSRCARLGYVGCYSCALETCIRTTLAVRGQTRPGSWIALLQILSVRSSTSTRTCHNGNFKAHEDSSHSY